MDFKFWQMRSSCCSRAMLASTHLSWKRNDLLIKCSSNRKCSLTPSCSQDTLLPPFHRACLYPRHVSTSRALTVSMFSTFLGAKGKPFFSNPALPQGLIQLQLCSECFKCLSSFFILLFCLLQNRLDCTFITLPWIINIHRYTFLLFFHRNKYESTDDWHLIATSNVRAGVYEIGFL